MGDRGGNQERDDRKRLLLGVSPVGKLAKKERRVWVGDKAPKELGKSPLNNFQNMTEWLEHSVLVEVNVPIDRVWSLWADLEQIPRWMSLICAVKVSPNDPNLSRWTLAAMGLQFSWQARLTRVVPHQIIQWESIDGVTNRGAVRFYESSDRTNVKLTVAYKIPGIVGHLMDDWFLGRFIESTLQSDMDRFRDYVESPVN